MERDLSFFNSWNDSLQVTLLKDRLPDELTYEGEFGTEIVTFLPFVFNLHLRGLLGNRKVSTYIGMSPYYFFLKSGTLRERMKDRVYVPVSQRWWPNNSEHIRVRTDGEIFPKYQRRRSFFRKPTIFIQNKFCVEWGHEPVNYIDLNTLRDIFEATKGTHQILYSRQGISSDENSLGISIDHNLELFFDDLNLCSEYKHVTILEQSKDKSIYNERKLEWINKSDLLVGVQGGGNYPWSYFSKTALILHIEGREADFSYEHGFYTYISYPRLNLHIARNYNEFLSKFKYLKNF